MTWIQVLTIIISVFGLVSGVLLFVMAQINQIGREMNTNMRDFHGRLCKLEEQYLQFKEEKK